MAMRQCFGGPLDGARVDDREQPEVVFDLATETVEYSENFSYPVFQVGGKRGCRSAARYRQSNGNLKFVEME